MTEAQDRELVRQCTRHDRDAWERFIECYQDYIYSLIHYSLGIGRYPFTREDAEDIFADVFLSLIERDYHLLRSFQWKCSLKTFLWAVTRKRVARHFRKKGARTHMASLSRTDAEGQVVGPEPPARDASPAENAENSEIRDLVNSTMADLGERDKLCLQLYFFDGMSYKEIAKIVGVPDNHVGIMIFRAKKKLEDRLKSRSL